jgi:hypothetical protein
MITIQKLMINVKSPHCLNNFAVDGFAVKAVLFRFIRIGEGPFNPVEVPGTTAGTLRLYAILVPGTCGHPASARAILVPGTVADTHASARYFGARHPCVTSGECQPL